MTQETKESLRVVLSAIGWTLVLMGIVGIFEVAHQLLLHGV